MTHHGGPDVSRRTVTGPPEAQACYPMHLDDALDDPYDSYEPLNEGDPERVSYWGSLAVAALGIAALIALSVSIAAAAIVDDVRTALATPVVTALATLLAIVTFLTGVGLVATGFLLHRGARRRVLAELTHEGLVEETSQEFDKVNARLERLELLATRESPRTPPRRPAERSDGPEPVPVNVLPGVGSHELRDERPSRATDKP